MSKFEDDPRGLSNLEIRKAIKPLKIGSIVNVSGFNDEDKQGGRYKNYFSPDVDYFLTYYPTDEAKGKTATSCKESYPVDLMNPLQDELVGQFDLALNHTVLEHVPNPFTGFEQITKMSKDLVLTVVPFRQVMHFINGNFGDYFRLSPMAMRYLHEINGLTTLYESVTPPPASTVYITTLATKHPEKYAYYPTHVPDFGEMNHIVGRHGAKDSAAHIVHAVAKKALSIIKRNG